MSVITYDIWERFVDWDNLFLAAKNAAKGKHYKPEIVRYNYSLESNLVELQNRLINGTWYPGPFRKFKVFEPKERIIHAPCYPDRVLHHALVQVILPCFERKFIYSSFACRLDKGTHAASNYLTNMIRSAHDCYTSTFVLKADISKYFYSIDHEILLNIISKTIGDPKIFEIIRRLVTKASCVDNNVGLPLGALTSQLFANVYLDQLDHYVKDDLSMKYYVRYMDDFVILFDDKQYLRKLLDSISKFLREKLKLKLNRKTCIFPVNQGVDFSGYRHWITHTLPRKRNIVNAKKRFIELSNKSYHTNKDITDKIRGSVASFKGYMDHCNGHRSYESTLKYLNVKPKD